MEAATSAKHFVVKRTFLELVDDDDDGSTDTSPHSPQGLGRRACSDSALLEMGSEAFTSKYDVGAEEESEQEEVVEFQLVGLSDGESDAGDALQQRTPELVVPNTAFGSLNGSECDFSFDAPQEQNNFVVETSSKFQNVLETNIIEPHPATLAADLALDVRTDELTPTVVAQQQDVPDVPTSLPVLLSSPVDTWDDRPIPREKHTTVMLRCLPNNYDRSMALAMLGEEGFGDKINFFYLPIDFKTCACLGYCFVNICCPSLVSAFWSAFDGYSRWKLPSRKVCRVSWGGPHQGLDAHVARYRNSPVMHDSVPDEYKPVIFLDGVRVPFPLPSKPPRAPRIRQRMDAGRPAGPVRKYECRNAF